MRALVLIAVFSQLVMLRSANGSDAQQPAVYSRLPYELRGAIISSDPINSVALLQQKANKKLVAVKPGFWMDHDTRVVSVFSAKTLILKRGESYEYLGTQPPPNEALKDDKS
jgi:hypothetical protein